MDKSAITAVDIACRGTCCMCDPQRACSLAVDARVRVSVLVQHEIGGCVLHKNVEQPAAGGERLQVDRKPSAHRRYIDWSDRIFLFRLCLCPQHGKRERDHDATAPRPRGAERNAFSSGSSIAPPRRGCVHIDALWRAARMADRVRAHLAAQPAQKCSSRARLLLSLWIINNASRREDCATRCRRPVAHLYPSTIA